MVAACLPAVRPLLRGKSVESMLNSLRSALSLHSLNNSQQRPDADGDHTARDTAIILDKVGKPESVTTYPSIDTEITGNYDLSGNIPTGGPTNAIYLQSRLGIKEERV